MTEQQYEAVALVLNASMPEDLVTVYKLPIKEAQKIHDKARRVLSRMAFAMPAGVGQ